MRRATLLLIASVVLTAACSSGDDSSSAAPDDESTESSTASSSSTTTTAPPPTVPATTVPPEGERGYEDAVLTLADDAMEGRDNETPGSEMAQDYLVDQLRTFAEPLPGGFRQRFDGGTNVVGVLRGVDLPDEYVILGAHYDHLGRDCRTSDEADDICNGAADNAAGVASVLEIGRRLAAGDPPSRSVIFAFWDAEEDGLVGSAYYVSNPLVPLEETITYLNWDMQGVNLLPSLRDVTFLIGAETGGRELVEAAEEATAASDLDTRLLSLLFGQGRSDHAVFAGAEVPTAFFSDSTAGCYHTAQDEPSNLDFEKLGKQIANGEALTRSLAASTVRPTFTAGTPIATYEDALSVLALVETGQDDVQRLSPEGREVSLRILAELQEIADAGPKKFDDDATTSLLGNAVELVDLLTAQECNGYTR